MVAANRPVSLHLLDELRTPGSPLRRQLCVAVSTISSRIAKEQQRALAQVRNLSDTSWNTEFCLQFSTFKIAKA
jgi:hypothetical protein